MGPSAPAGVAPEWTPGRSDVSFPDSMVPMAASTVQGSPGHVAAAASYRMSIAAGICALALGALSPPPRRDATPAPAPAARTATRRTSPAAPAASLVPRPPVSLFPIPMLTDRARPDVTRPALGLGGQGQPARGA